MKRGLRGWLHEALSQVVRDEMADSRRVLAAERAQDLQRADIVTSEQREVALRRETERDAALAHALTQLSMSIAQLTDRLASDVSERGLMSDSIEWMMRELVLSAYAVQPLAAPVLAQPLTVAAIHTLHGGTIEQLPARNDADAQTIHDGLDHSYDLTERDISIDFEPAIDLRELLEAEELVVGTRVEVRSRFQQAWIHGFAILEVIGEVHNRHYRLSRLSDHLALPVLFGHEDIRIVPSLMNPEDSVE